MAFYCVITSIENRSASSNYLLGVRLSNFEFLSLGEHYGLVSVRLMERLRHGSSFRRD